MTPRILLAVTLLAGACSLLPLPTNAPFDDNACAGVSGTALKRHVFVNGDMHELDGVACVAGDVHIHAWSSFALPALVKVGGELDIAADGPDIAVDLPALVDGRRVSLQGRLKRVTAPQYRGSFVVSDAATVVDAPLATAQR